MTEHRVRGAVGEDSARLGELYDPPVEGAVVGRRDDEPHSVEILLLERPLPSLHESVARELRASFANLRRDHPNPGAGRGQHLGLAGPHPSGADHQAGHTPEIEKDRELFHRSSPRPYPAARFFRGRRRWKWVAS